MNKSEQEREWRMEETTCVHFTGETGVCKAGVEYDNVRRKNIPLLGSRSSLPCVGCLNDCGAKCDQYQAPSLAEIVADRQRRQHLLAAAEAVRRDARGLRGVSGVIECPACKMPFKYTVVAISGHMRGRCATEGCLSFIQ